ncbi:5-histidylcysteine sulfoxide synthase [Acidithiobacillus sp.]|uniref:5-histidylcysteine sulfoxide synthase n=1 Tax=Acidithiobacillus sp. TaxID=1872118 RepID=UPI0025C61FAD|nr:5-histidylcysteine sulfoxide synthase [Acidithiobacillus sp.]
MSESVGALRLDGTDAEQKREEIRRLFHNGFSRYERLFEHLADDRAWYEKAISLRHPLIFYFGHTATFFTNKFRVAGLIEEHLDPVLESIFAVGVDEMSWDDLDESHYDWPSVEAVRAYRARVREMVDAVIRRLPLSLPITWESPWWAVLMGIEHENIHLETSSVLMRQLPLERVRPVPEFAPEPLGSTRSAPRNELIPIPAGLVRLGKERHSPLYGWDNEYGEHRQELGDFAASRYLVSNGEFLEFVEAGGYGESRWWGSEGDAWRRFAGARHPSFWQSEGGQWQLRLIAELRPMPWDWPVEVNYHEAAAFCAWKSAQTGEKLRLPTEDEWRRLRDLSGLPDADAWREAPGQIALAKGCSPCPVDRYRHGDCYDVVGNVWQWTETPIYPFPGFEVHPYYDDFTVPTFDQRHNLIKGGSFISCGNETQREARYAFRRHFFQHAGFRYVRSDNPLPQVPVYESDTLVAQYCDFHYGPSHFEVANYPAAMARLALEALGDGPRRRALDIGCAVGRSTFELARVFDEVVGIDFSARFIQVGVQLQSRGRFPYAVVEEGELQSYHWADLAALGLQECSHRVQFFQGDACNLKPIHRDFDLVLAANLIDRLREPEVFLKDIAGRIRPGGLLVISSPYTWLEEFTPKEHWLGGFKKDGENFSTLRGLHVALDGLFRLRPGFPRDLPFVIRETARKFQHSVAEVTVWERLPA